MRYTIKKKGLRMSKDLQENPDKYKHRVCIAYDSTNQRNPYMYVLIGNHDHKNDHDIRKIYAKTTGTPYYATRLVLYSTYIKRVNKKKVENTETLFLINEV